VWWGTPVIPALRGLGVPGKPGLQSETLSKNKERNERNRERERRKEGREGEREEEREETKKKLGFHLAQVTQHPSTM
jgi:hypothetical protein